MDQQLRTHEIVSRAPCRVSFAGGGTDVSPFPELYGGVVINATINVMVEARLRLREDSYVLVRSNRRRDTMIYRHVNRLHFDKRLDFLKALIQGFYVPGPGFELSIHSPIPIGAGLGGSGAMAVAVLGAFNVLARPQLSRCDLAELAYKIETEVMHNATGRQDQYAAAYGGVNELRFHRNGRVQVVTFSNAGATKDIFPGLLLVWLGRRQEAGGRIIEAQSRGVAEGGSVVRAMQATKAAVPLVQQAIQAGDIQALGKHLDRLWALKQEFSEGISNWRIQNIYSKAKAAGAIGGKITGAGGGGHMLLCIDPRDPSIRRSVVAALAREGLKTFPVELEHMGLTVTKERIGRTGESSMRTIIGTDTGPFLET